MSANLPLFDIEILPLAVITLQKDMPTRILNDNPTIIINSNREGTIEIGGSCGIATPNVINADVNTTITFETPGIGLHDNCTVTLVDLYGSRSNTLNLGEIEVYKVLNNKLLYGRSDGKGLDYVIMGDGFTENEMSIFREKAGEYADYILDYDSDLALQKNAWNIHMIELVSKESGSDNTHDENNPKVETALDSYFYCGGIERLLCVNNTKAPYIASNIVPQFDKVLIIVNSNKYGGAGGNYATASIDDSGKDIAIHELGHSLAGLADEYEGQQDAPWFEPNAANITINNDAESVKWRHWYGESTSIESDGPIGLYEGGQYTSWDTWRPTRDSIMRTLGKPFYQVNAEAWALSVYKMAGTYYDKLPQTVEVVQNTGEDTLFELTPSMGLVAQKITWRVNGINQNISRSQFSFSFGNDINDNYVVEAIIEDKTDVIRRDDYNYSKDIITWNVTTE